MLSSNWDHGATNKLNQLSKIIDFSLGDVINFFTDYEFCL